MDSVLLLWSALYCTREVRYTKVIYYHNYHTTFAGDGGRNVKLLSHLSIKKKEEEKKTWRPVLWKHTDTAEM